MADTSYNTPNYQEQGGKRFVIGPGGKLRIEGQITQGSGDTALPYKVAISAAAGAANISLVTFQVQDNEGNALAAVFNLDIWLSDAASGAGLTATTASGAVAASTGADLGTYTAKKALRSQTDATGKYVLSITDTAKSGFIPCATVPGTGQTQAGAALVAGNYG